MITRTCPATGSAEAGCCFPVVLMLRSADLIGERTDAEAYLRVARERYRLMRTHERSDDIIERLRREIG
jgi:hypothetical protein